MRSDQKIPAELDDVYQELQQSGSIVTVDLAVLIVAVTVQSLLCVEVNCVCSLLVQQNSVSDVYTTVQVGITKQNIARSYQNRWLRCWLQLSQSQLCCSR